MGRHPTVDFDGAVLVGSLEIGCVLIGRQRLPTVRFLVSQSRRKYHLLACGKKSGEVYAYALAAAGRGMVSLEAHIVAVPHQSAGKEAVVFVVDDGKEINWYSGSELRVAAAQKLVEIMNGETVAPSWPIIEEPFTNMDYDE